jgi:serine/threonine protein kinase
LYNVTFVKTFSSGKSGDNVLLIKIENREYVLKIFKNTNKYQHKEVNEHLDINKLFKSEKDYIPCPILYCYGYLSISDVSDVSLYMIIEYVKGNELYSLLKQHCLKQKPSQKIDVLTIMFELFYFIGTLIMHGKRHCDLHPHNILITQCLKQYTLDFSSFTSLPIKVPVTNYMIKVIDFGKTESRGIPCLKNRETTVELNKLSILCTSSSYYMDLILGFLNLGSGNSDLNFFCQMLRICASFDERVAKIGIENIEKIHDISREFDTLKVSDKKSVKSVLSRILKLLVSGETNKDVSKFRKKRSKSGTKKSKRKTKNVTFKRAFFYKKL